MLQDIFTSEKYSRIHTAAVDPYHEPMDPGHLPTFNGSTGELMKNVPLQRMYRISRRRFRAFCAEDIKVHYNKKLADISYSNDGKSVTATFEDGSDATGTMIVGTDGAQSKARYTIFGPESSAAKRVPYSAVNLHVCYNDAEKAKFVRQAHPIMTMGIHPEGYWLWISIQDVPDPDDPATWVFQLQSTWKAVEGENVASLENLKRRAATYGEPFRSANLWIPDGTPIYENKLSYWVPEPWDTKGGRVLLAGDAAHPMTFQRGQGLNHGIADARSLVAKMKDAVDGKITVEEATSAYQKEMVDRAGEEVRLSTENTEMLHDWERMAQSPLMQRGGYAKGQEVSAAPPVGAKA
jgi:2-polyprenyl-6-methoxyphenol hydroxylase-like FAD-dependent oxidoreductase